MRKQRKEGPAKRLRRLARGVPSAYRIAGASLALVTLLSLSLILRQRGVGPEPQVPYALVPLEGSEEHPWGFFHPAWKQETGALLNVKSHLGVSDAFVDEKVRRLVGDPNGRIEREFQVPPGLRDRVAFWMEIYSRFNSHMRVVHDRDRPALIFGYIDFRPLYRALGSSAVVDAKANALEKKILKELKARLLEGIGVTGPSLIDATEKAQIQAFLSRVGAFGVKDTEMLIAQIRTQSGQADFFKQALYRSRNLLPHIEAVFRRQSLPVALGRIPFVESSFNARAYSKGGAMGIWQFMPETAKQMIRGNDESAWADPLKQTASAARVLKLYRSVLPDWGTTVTSYNSGVGRVRKLVAKHHVKDVEGIIAINDDDGLGFAGKNFFSEFLAANLVEGYKEQLFDDPNNEPIDSALVFRGGSPFQKETCDPQLKLGI